MTTRIIDQASDPGYATLQVLVERFPKLKEFSKHAELSDEEFSALPDSAFAWPSKRKFPVHSKEHTALSMGYCKTASAIPAEVAECLKKSATIYDIDADVFDEAPVKVASEETWLLDEQKRFRVASAEDVKLAEEILPTKRLTLENKLEAYNALCKTAEKFGVTLSPSTQKLAGFTATDTQKLKTWLEAREELTHGTPMQSAYTKLAQAYGATEPIITDRLYQVKLANAIHELDKEAGVTERYGKDLLDPLASVFNTDIPSKTIMKIGSAFYDKAQLGQLPASFWEDTLGPDITQEIAPDGVVDVESLVSILNTLPDDMKAMVQSQLANTGQRLG